LLAEAAKNRWNKFRKQKVGLKGVQKKEELKSYSDLKSENVYFCSPKIYFAKFC
jgi:hypothetical protein